MVAEWVTLGKAGKERMNGRVACYIQIHVDLSMYKLQEPM
jgi:hypothetical protein